MKLINNGSEQLENMVINKKGENMKKNNKGFTMIEIMAVIIILGILAGLVVPAVTKYVNRSKKDYFNSLEQEIIIMAKDYFSVNKSQLPTGKIDKNNNIKYQTKIDIDVLEKGGYTTNDIVSKDGEKCDGFAVVERIAGQKDYTYKVCLKCGDDQTENCKIEKSEKSTETPGTLACNIKPKIGENEYIQGTWATQDVILELSSAYYETGSDKIIDDKPNITTYYLNDSIKIKPNTKGKITKYTISESLKKDNLKINTYAQEGVYATCNLKNVDIKIDKKVPSCKMTDKFIENKTKKEITIKGIDETSGIASIKIDNKDIPLTGGTNLEKTGHYVVGKNGTYEATITDIAGNTNICQINIDGLDKEPPIITLSVEPGNNKATINAKITDNQGVKKYLISTSTETPKDGWKTINVAKSIDVSFNETTANTYYVYAKDESDNIGKEKVVLKYVEEESCGCKKTATRDEKYGCEVTEKYDCSTTRKVDCNPHNCNPYSCGCHDCNCSSCNCHSCNCRRGSCIRSSRHKYIDHDEKGKPYARFSTVCDEYAQICDQCCDQCCDTCCGTCCSTCYHTCYDKCDERVEKTCEKQVWKDDGCTKQVEYCATFNACKLTN